MKIFLLTCPSLANKRLVPAMKQLSPLIANGLVEDIEIICGTDKALFEELDISYDSGRWETDIRYCWDIFCSNISLLSGIDAAKILEMNPTDIFPRRRLTVSEQSIAMRHIKAIKMIAEEKRTCIVLEDDIIVENYKNVNILIKNLLDDYRKITFFDLCDDFIPYSRSNDSVLMKISGLRIVARPIAITRTLMAYAMNRKTAKVISGSVENYSLPIDMHLQVVLKKKLIPGMCITSKLFRHGSKTGGMRSAINQR